MLLGKAQGVQAARAEKFKKSGAQAKLTSHANHDGETRAVAMNVDADDGQVVENNFSVSDGLIAEGIKRLSSAADCYSDQLDPAKVSTLIQYIANFLTPESEQARSASAALKPRLVKIATPQTKHTGAAAGDLDSVLPGEEKLRGEVHTLDLTEQDVTIVRDVYVNVYHGKPNTTPEELKILQSKMIYDTLRWNKQPHEKAERIMAKKMAELKSDVEVWVFLASKFKSIGLTCDGLQQHVASQQEAQIPEQKVVPEERGEYRSRNDSTGVAYKKHVQKVPMIHRTLSNPVHNAQSSRNLATKSKKDPFADIGGLQEELDLVKMAFFQPDSWYPDDFKRPSGLLMYGPPGNGKTLLALCFKEYLSSHLKKDFDFQVINGSEYMTKYVGGAEEKIKEIFDNAEAREKRGEGGTVLFIDEIDALAPSRDGVGVTEVERRPVSVLLTQMDGFKTKGQESKVFLIAATNRRDAMDPALLRPGRFDYHIEIPNRKRRRGRGGRVAFCLILCCMTFCLRCTDGLSSCSPKRSRSP
jgi:ATP-dependent 26S proteasome regulatory subunit